MHTRDLLLKSEETLAFVEPSDRDRTPQYSLFTVPVSVAHTSKPVRALLDCGAIGNFVSRQFVTENRIPCMRKYRPTRLKLADGSTPSVLDEEVMLEVNLGGDFRPYRARFTVVPTLVQPLILGMPFFYEEGPL